jgi:uncharacterized protein (TIGR00266 family)
MKVEILGKPSFSYINFDLEPGESFYTETGSMVSMATGIEVKPKLNGNIFSAFFKKFLGGESFFINKVTNVSDSPQRIVISQALPGDIRETTIAAGEAGLVLQPGAFLAATPGIKLSVGWAGFVSFIAREGLFKLQVTGEGKVWYGAFGGLVVRKVEGEHIVDTSHLVAYQPHLKLKLKLAGGIFSSFFGGEGIVTRVVGDGAVILQTRSLHGMKSWINPKLLP